MNRRTFNLILMSLSLFCGGAIYLIFRPETYISSLFANSPLIKDLRVHFAFVDCKFVQFYFVDYLWEVSFCCGFVAIFLPKKQNLFKCVAFPFCLGVVWEILQYFNLTKGTGDVIDVLMYLFAGITVIFINIKEKKT